VILTDKVRGKRGSNVKTVRVKVNFASIFCVRKSDQERQRRIKLEAILAYCRYAEIGPTVFEEITFPDSHWLASMA
jgi:hypothetical protein